MLLCGVMLIPAILCSVTGVGASPGQAMQVTVNRRIETMRPLSVPSDITMTLQNDEWQVTAVVLMQRGFTDADLQAIASTGALESFEVCDAGNLPYKNVSLERLRGLRQLRRLSIPIASPADWKAVASLKGLEDIDLTRCWGEARTAALQDLHKCVVLKRVDLGPDATDRELVLVGDVKALEELAVKGAAVSDEGIVALAGCRELRCLDIRQTKVSGRGLASLQELKHLKSLRCGSAHLDIEPSPLAKLSALTWLDMGTAKGVVGDELKFPASLQRLSLSTATLPVVLKNTLPDGIVRIDVRGREWKRTSLPDNVGGGVWGGHFHNVTDLWVECGDDERVKDIAAMQTLRRLELGSCTALDDERATLIAGMKNLRGVIVASVGPRLTARGIASLCGMAKLELLELNDLSGDTAQQIGVVVKAKGLKTLGVGWHTEVRLDASVLADIGGLDKLESLVVHNAIIGDDGLRKLETLKTLRVLDVRQCHGYTDEALGRLMKALPELRVVKRSYAPDKKR